jgi:hypothetical protein
MILAKFSFKVAFSLARKLPERSALPALAPDARIEAGRKERVMEDKKMKQMTVQISIDEQTAQGIYANMAVVQHSPSEFVLDFIFINPGQPVAKVRSRIIISPDHAKRLHKVLGENLNLFEKQFGEIKIFDIPKPADTVQ